MELGNLLSRCKGSDSSGKIHKNLSTNTGHRGGLLRSPLLANLFLHYAFDVWMSRNYPDKPFERFADDAIVHCRTREEAKIIRHLEMGSTR